MNFSRFYSLPVAVLASLAFCLFNIPAGAAEGVAVPPYEQVQQLYLRVSSGWMLNVRPDGSGELVFGSSASDVGNIPSGSLDLRDFYDAVASTLHAKPAGTKSFAVHLRRAGDVSITALYTSNEMAATKIVMAAKAHATPFNKERFDELLRKYPLLPKD